MSENSSKKAGFSARIIHWVKTLRIRKILLMLVSLFFALVLWGYVLSDQNPERIRQIQDVSVRLVGEQEMLNRNLVICGDRQALLEKVNVNVQVRLNNYWLVAAENINASIDLSGIGGPGVYDLPIRATSNYGTVTVQKRSVQIVVDDLVSKNVPVEADVEGELAEAYWMSGVELSTGSLNIQGPKQEVDLVRKAVCRIPIEGRTQSYNDSLQVELVDESGQGIQSSTIPSYSVNATLNILPKKTVPFDLQSSISGMDRLSANYEIINTLINPAEVEIAAPQHILDDIVMLELEPRSIVGATQSFQENLTVKAPPGVVYIQQRTVNVLIEIQEKHTISVFDSLPVQVVGLNRGLAAELSQEHVRLTVRGPVSEIDKISRASLQLEMDLTDLQSGIYMLDVTATLPDTVTMDDVVVDVLPKQLSVNIQER